MPRFSVVANAYVGDESPLAFVTEKSIHELLQRFIAKILRLNIVHPQVGTIYFYSIVCAWRVYPSFINQHQLWANR